MNTRRHRRTRLLWLFLLCCSVLLFTRCKEEVPVDTPEKLARRIESGDESAVAVLLKQKRRDYAYAQNRVANYYERKWMGERSPGFLLRAAAFYRIAKENGKRPDILANAADLYWLSRTEIDDEQREGMEDLLILCSGADAGRWQRLLGDDYEFEDGSRAHAAWQAARTNGQRDAWPRYAAPCSWLVRNWAWILLTLLIGGFGARYVLTTRRGKQTTPESSVTIPLDPKS